METKSSYMKKGKYLAMLFATIGLIIVISILTFFGGFRGVLDLLFDFPLNFSVGITSLLLSSYFLGSLMEHLVVKKKKNAVLVGIALSFVILIISTLFGSTVGFVEEALPNRHFTLQKAIYDYYYKPLFWVLLIGLIPVSLLGWRLGLAIKKHNV